MINVEAKEVAKKFTVGMTVSFDVSVEVSCENDQAAIQAALNKLSEYATAELTLTLLDGTVVKPTIHNSMTNDSEVFVEEK